MAYFGASGKEGNAVFMSGEETQASGVSGRVRAIPQCRTAWLSIVSLMHTDGRAVQRALKMKPGKAQAKDAAPPAPSVSDREHEATEVQERTAIGVQVV